MNVMQLWKGALVVALMAAVLATAGTAMAGTIVQDHTTHLAFEAENFDSVNDIGSDGVNWTVISDAGASEGEAIKAPAAIDFANEGEFIYNLEFTKATDFYSVYARYKNLGSASSDSFLTSSTTPASTNQLRRWFDGPADVNRAIGNASHGTTGTYYYAFLGNTAAVPAGTYEFRLGIREKDVEVDRILFVDNSSATSGGPLTGVVNGRAIGSVGTVQTGPGFEILDALANSSHVPEPASGALLACGMLATLGMRRRHG